VLLLLAVRACVMVASLFAAAALNLSTVASSSPHPSTVWLPAAETRALRCEMRVLAVLY